MQCFGQHRLEMVPIIRQLVKGKILRDAVHAPRLGNRLEGAHQQLTRVFLVIRIAIGIAQDREIRRYAIHRLGDDVKMLGGVQRHVHAAHGADLPAPHPAAVDHILGSDITALGNDTRDAAVTSTDRRDLSVLEYRDAAHLRTLGDCPGHVAWVYLTVTRKEHGADHVLDVEQRPLLARLLGSDDHYVEAKAAGHRRTALELFKALLVGRNGKRAILFESGGLPGLLLQGAEQLAGVLC